MNVDYDFQMLIWGAAYSGNVADTNAVLAETGGIGWDETLDTLNSYELHHEGRVVPVPRYWALHGVTKLLAADDVLAVQTLEKTLGPLPR